jgi:hypothetical protein
MTKDTLRLQSIQAMFGSSGPLTGRSLSLRRFRFGPECNLFR